MNWSEAAPLCRPRCEGQSWSGPQAPPQHRQVCQFYLVNAIRPFQRTNKCLIANTAICFYLIN